MPIRYTVKAAAVLVIAAAAAPPAHADPAPQWNGWYRVTFHVDQKSGSSMAAGQPEEPYTVSYHYDRLPPGSQRWEYICDVQDPLWNTALGFKPGSKN